jgi:hypothetical protein
MQAVESILYFRSRSCIKQIRELPNWRHDPGFFGDVAFSEQKVDGKLTFR